MGSSNQASTLFRSRWVAAFALVVIGALAACGQETSPMTATPNPSVDSRLVPASTAVVADVTLDDSGMCCPAAGPECDALAEDLADPTTSEPAGFSASASTAPTGSSLDSLAAFDSPWARLAKCIKRFCASWTLADEIARLKAQVATLQKLLRFETDKITSLQGRFDALSAARDRTTDPDKRVELWRQMSELNQEIKGHEALKKTYETKLSEFENQLKSKECE